MKFLKIFLIIIIVLCVNTGLLQAQGSDERIAGAANFLIDRAQENMLYLFEENLKENELLKLYLPNTYSAIQRASLRIILTDKKLWEDNIESDIYELSLKIANRIAQGLHDDLIDQFLEKAGQTSIRYNGNLYSITSLPVNPRIPELEELINPIYRVSDIMKKVQDATSINYLETALDSTDSQQFDMLVSIVDSTISLFQQWQVDVNLLALEPDKE